jgi:ATP-dependent helicase/nuclease subunit A
MNKLAEIVKNFGGIYSRLKKEKMSMDYNDLEHYCLPCSVTNRRAREIKAQYDYVFVDEYQDTNFIQEEIITKAVNENALFAVGDIKQSIYRFREAETGYFYAAVLSV